MKDIINKKNKEIIDEEFSFLTKNKNVSVKYIDEYKGKGVFSKKEFKFGEIIFYEEPIVSQKNINNDEKTKNCSYCLKNFKPDYYKFKKTEYEKYYPKEIIQCDSCDMEYYCSIECKNKSWKNYHNILCTENKFKKMEKNHPLNLFNIHSKIINRTNPLLILKIFANIFQNISNGQTKYQALRPFFRFTQNKEFSEKDSISVDLIKKILSLKIKNDNILNSKI
jgi:hypothetical protein